MQFRTEIEPVMGTEPITHDDRIVMLGSCFTDNIGEKLACRGFAVSHNPMGPLYNPASLLNIVRRARQRRAYTVDDLVADSNGTWHCLDFALRYSDTDRDALLSRVNTETALLADALDAATVVILTLGTVRTFALGGNIVGNCHKLPGNLFAERFLGHAETTALLGELVALLGGKRVIFTVSPIRHTGYGLHAGQISKATLLLAVDDTCRERDNVSYFPAYEIMLDDLRDYRFYAADMKHPSDVAIEYIYEKFSLTYFDKTTLARAEQCYKQHLHAAHRQNIQS